MRNPGRSSRKNVDRSPITSPKRPPADRGRYGATGYSAGSPAADGETAARRRRGRSSETAKIAVRALAISPHMRTSRTRYASGPARSNPSQPATSTAIKPPATAATMLVTFSMAKATANSSLRCSARLCSIRNGFWTTKKTCCPPPYRAARRPIAIGSRTTTKPTRATSIRARPPARTSRRPTRSDSALAGKATSVEATAPAVAIRPITAGVRPIEAR
jgi:hypothetical protein